MALTATPANAQVTHREPIRCAKSVFVSGSLAVDGATELDGNVDMNGTLTVDGASTLTGAVGVTGALSPAGGITSTGRITTTDGVASGTAKVVGGQAYSAVSAADNLLASAGGSAHVNFAQDVTIPANTLKAGTHVKIRGLVRVTDASGTDTLEVKLYFGPNASETTLLTSTAFDPDAAGDFVKFEFDLWSRAAPAASVGITGYGNWVSLDGSTLARSDVILAPANFDTTAALKVEVSAKWSATTASTNARLEVLDVEII